VLPANATAEMILNFLEMARNQERQGLVKSELPSYRVGLRNKADSMKRWLEITSDGSVP
jgi:hypothetical protein